MSAPLLEVVDLEVSFDDGYSTVAAVRGVTFSVEPGEVVGIVGESGSGKTLTALAIADLLPPSARRNASELRFRGVDLLGADRRTRASILGTGLAVVFQDPMASLNPALRVGTQLTEAARRHRHLSRREASVEAVQRLRHVRIAAAERRMRNHPHELSGGMRQRTMIGMGLMVKPQLLVADEPTTALDVTVQADVVDLLKRINAREQVAILLISHNVALIAGACTRVLVMYAGRIVEDIPVEQLRSEAVHPYTRALMGAVPSLRTIRHEPLITIPGAPPDPAQLPAGCPFHPRCPFAHDRCVVEPGPLAVSVAHHAACWLAEDQR